MNFPYNWTKVWAVRTMAENPIQPGEIIIVNDRKGGSAQEVLSVTDMTTQTGTAIKVLLLRALSQDEVLAEAARREAVRNAHKVLLSEPLVAE